MRTFEIILLLLVSIVPFVKRPLLRMVRPVHIYALLGSFLLVHLLVEGGRWQMMPVYLLVIILGWRMQVAGQHPDANMSILRAAGFVALVVFLVPAWILPAALPVFTLPEPTGSYPVGTQTLFVTTDRPETITADPDDRRELSYKIWYPAESSSGTKDPYVDRASRAGFATKYGLPSGALNYLDLVETHASLDAPVAAGRFPVLLFSHGYGSKATGYYALLTEIASQGYVIINMNHTYESLGVSRPDGTEGYFDYAYQGEIAAGSGEVVEPLIQAFKDDLTYEERHPIVRQATKNYFMREVNDRWADDMIYSLDLLDTWNSKGFLKGKLNLDQVGAFGHSVGGGAVGRVAIRDQRIKAAVNLDGIQWGDMIDSTYRIPYLYVSADWPPEHEDVNAHIYINKSTETFYETKLLQSGHPNFMDIPLMIPVQALAGTGSIDPYLGLEIVNHLVTSFFDQYLRKTGGGPQAIAEQYDLLEMTVYRGDSVR